MSLNRFEPKSTRYEPCTTFKGFNQALDNMLQLFNQDDSYVEGGSWFPAVDIKDEKDKFLINADIPGVDKNNIHIHMKNNILTIRGEREEISKAEKNSYSRMERIQGSFYRQFTLPDTADSEKISAKAKNGVLQIVIPKKEAALPRQIRIETDENKRE